MAELTLRWEKFGLSKGLHDMLGAGELVDVTLACQGEFIQAHKTVLAACSPHFRALFKMNPCQHPIVIMQDVRLPHLQALLNFMYQGEATVNQNELPGFLRTAEALRISGLAPKNQANQHCGDQSDESTGHSEPSTQPPRLSPIPPNKRPRRSKDSGWHDSSRLYIPTQGAGNDYMQSDNIKLEDEISLEEADDWPSCSETNAKEFASMDESNSPNPQASAQVCWFEAGPSSSQAQPGTSTQQQTLPDVSTKGTQTPGETVPLLQCNQMPPPTETEESEEEITAYTNIHKCHICERTFLCQSHLVKHFKHEHQHDDRPVSCITC